MNKQLRYAYRCVGMGWWRLLDKFIPAILAIDPDCEFEPKEKFGELRLQAFVSVDLEKDKKCEICRLEQEAEDLSQTVCEYCGKPGKPRTQRDWFKTLCDDCDALDAAGVERIWMEQHRRVMEIDRMED